MESRAGFMSSAAYCGVQTFLTLSGLSGFLSGTGCNVDGAFLTMLYSGSSLLMSFHALITYQEMKVRQNKDLFGWISCVCFVIQAIFTIIFAMFIKANLTMIHTGCLNWYWSFCLNISTISIWIGIVWISLARILPALDASYKLAEKKLEDKKRLIFFTELEDFYGSIYNSKIQDKLYKFLKENEKLVSQYELSDMEIARLKDMFKCKQLDKLTGSHECPECSKHFYPEEKILSHPACGHLIHMDCINFKKLQSCPSCSTPTRYNMLIDMRKELYPSM